MCPWVYVADGEVGDGIVEVIVAALPVVTHAGHLDLQRDLTRVVLHEHAQPIGAVHHGHGGGGVELAALYLCVAIIEGVGAYLEGDPQIAVEVLPLILPAR